MIHDDLKLKGRLDIVVTSEDGVVKQKESVENLVVTSGKNFVVDTGHINVDIYVKQDARGCIVL